MKHDWTKRYPSPAKGLILVNVVAFAFLSATVFLSQRSMPIEDINIFISGLAFIIGINLIFIAIKKIKQAEIATAGLRKVAETAHDGIITVDANQKIIYFNKAAEKMFGYQAKEILGKTLQTLMPERYKPSHESGMKRFLKTGQVKGIGTTVELGGRKSNGEEFPLELSLSQWFNGKDRYFTGIIRDITERKLLDVERQRFVSLVQNSKDFIGISDLNQNMTFLNDAAIHLVDTVPLDASKKTKIDQYFHADDLPHLHKVIIPTVIKKGHWEGETHLLNQKTSVRIPVRMTAFLIKEQMSGDPLGLATVSQDISEQKRLEEERDRFFSVSLDMLCISGTDGRFKRLNPAFWETLGYTSEEMFSRPILDFVHPDDLPATLAEIERQNNGNSVMSFKNRFLCKDGTYKWLSWKSVPIGDAFYGAARDITDLITTETNLRAHQQQLADAQQIAHIGSWSYNIALEKISWSEELYRIYGLNPDETMIDLELARKMAHPDHQQKNRDMIQKAIQTGESFQYDYRIVRPSGEIRQLHCRGEVVTDEHGKPMTIIGTIQDVTEARVSETELVKARETAVEASRLKSEFLANMSHEIRTPINGVLGMTQLILDTGLTSEQKDFAENIQSSAESLLTVINDILDFSKVEAGKLEIEILNFDLYQLIIDVEKFFAYSASRKDLDFHTNTILTGPTFYKGDPGRIRQILSNLVSNAIKFTKSGSVVLSLHIKKDGSLHFEVSDTGMGITPETLERLFKAFSQADSSTTRKFGGTGLGLSICKHLVEMMGGQIGVITQEGKGSTFWFDLRLEQGESLHQKDANEPIKRSIDFSGAKILVAEDNVINQKIALLTLERMGFRAQAVANGLEVLAALKTMPFDLVLMDCQMPEMDGYEATRAIRSSPSLGPLGIPIIAMTANALKGDKEKCLEAGMNDYVAKPIKAADLAIVLERWLQLTKEHGPEEITQKKPPRSA